MKKTLLGFAFIAALAGCASTPQMGNVLPLEGGKYQVDGVGSSADDALESALYSAETTCKAQHKHHVVVGQNKQYKGFVSEDANRAVTSAAQTLAAATGKMMPTLSNEDDYRITLTFRCEA